MVRLIPLLTLYIALAVFPVILVKTTFDNLKPLNKAVETTFTKIK